MTTVTLIFSCSVNWLKTADFSKFLAGQCENDNFTKGLKYACDGHILCMEIYNLANNMLTLGLGGNTCYYCRSSVAGRQTHGLVHSLHFGSYILDF